VRGDAIYAVNEAFRLKKDLRFPEDKNIPENVTKKAEALFRHTSDIKFDRNFMYLLQGNKSC